MNFWKILRVTAAVAFILVTGLALWTADAQPQGPCGAGNSGMRCMPTIR